jgi:hypothetical protein
MLKYSHERSSVVINCKSYRLGSSVELAQPLYCNAHSNQRRSKFMRIIPIVAGLGLGLSLLGCQAESLSQVGTAPRQAITFAATAHYPGNPTTSPTVHAAAVADSSKDTLTIYNLGDTTIPASTLWVNGHFVRQIPAIAPRASHQVTYNELIQAGPGVQTLKQLGQGVNTVELQTAEGLFKVEGPATPS